MGSDYIQFRILYILYEKFESDGYSRDVRAIEIFDNPELNYLDSKVVSAEIDYLAGKKFIIGSSSTGHSPYSWVRISSEGVEITRFIIRDYPIFLRDNGDKEYKQKYDQISATTSEIGKRLEIFAFIKEHVQDFEDFLMNTHAISDSPIPHKMIKPQGGNTYNIHTGNVFQNIENSTIVNDSSIKNAFNKLASDKETSDALMEIADYINKSGDLSAGVIFNSFTDELNKQIPDKSRLEKLWSGIEKVLPAVTTVAGAATKIISSFG